MGFFYLSVLFFKSPPPKKIYSGSGEVELRLIGLVYFFQKKDLNIIAYF